MDLMITDQTHKLADSYLLMIEDLLNFAARKLALADDTEMSVTFVDNQAIQKINRDYRKKDAVTDVISFAIEDASDDEMEDLVSQTISELLPRNLGDIFIAIERAKEQAEEYNHSFERELGFLAVHGFLHLNGYDHMTPDDEVEMFSLQREILDEYGLQRNEK